MLKYYSLAIGFIVISLLVLGMAIMYLSKDIRYKNMNNLGNNYLIPNITFISLGMIWFALGVYLTIIVKVQLM